MPNVIGLDLGTTTVTGVLLAGAGSLTGRRRVLLAAKDSGPGSDGTGSDGRVLPLARRRNDAALPTAWPTRAEQDPHRLRALALEVLAELASGGWPVDGLALTGQMHGLLCVDANDRPLTPLISWQDQRTAEPLGDGTTTLQRLQGRLEDLDWRANGCRLAHGYGAAILFWLMQQGELPAGTRRVCTLAGWLAGQLAGQAPLTDPTFAASWGVYHLVDGAWNAGFLARLALDPGLLPSLRPSGARLGGLAPRVARQVGLPQGLPVFNALGDTQASFLGAMLPEDDLSQDALVGTILFNLGTGGQICWPAPRFEPPSEAVETRPLLPGRYLRVGASLCGGAAYAWLKNTVRAWLAEFGLEVDEESVYRRLNALAEARDGSVGLRVRTTFLGSRSDAAVQTGAIEGITPDNLRLGPLARATLAGIVDELYDLYHTEAGEMLRPRRVVATGGGVRQIPLLPGLIEARFGLPVGVPPQRETAAVGAAALAAGSGNALEVPPEGA
jgi:sedoheptulokinase